MTRLLTIFVLLIVPVTALGMTSVSMTHETGHIIVKANINGKGPYTFILDTGATGFGRIDSYLVKELNLPITGQTLNSDGSNWNTQIHNLILIDSLSLGDKKFTELTFIAQNFHDEETADGHIDGVLGLELFEKFLLTIDYRQNKITLGNDRLSPADDNTIKYNRGESGRHCLVPLEIGSKRFNALLDTGNQWGLTVSHRFLRDVPTVGNARHCGAAKTTSNTYTLYEVKAKEPLNIAGVHLSDTRIQCARYWRQPNLGYRLLKHFTISLDQSNQLIRFVRN